MSDLKLIKDPFARRSFITGAAKAMLGIGAMPMLSQLAAASPAPTTPTIGNKVGGKAKSVIYLYMDGGMSHLDTFDTCLLYTSPSPRDLSTSRMPSSA